MTRMTGIVDYGAGNVRSVERALAALGVPQVMTDDAAVLSKCDRLIVPGVGEASYAMDRLRRTGLDSFLAEWARCARPLMGICLGSQIIFDHSDEGGTKCLGLVPGNVRRFKDVWHLDTPPIGRLDTIFVQGSVPRSGKNHSTTLTSDRKQLLGYPDMIALKVPHIGWNNLVIDNGGSHLLASEYADADYYFVHSYVMCPADSTVVKAYTDYGGLVPAVVEFGSVQAFQFHPEKSGEAGLDILRRFCA